MLSSTTYIARGTTVNFSTTFRDADCNVVQPASATINIVYADAANPGPDTVSIAMVAPVAPSTAWTAQWDTRGAGVGAVSFSVHSDPGPPYAVEDGSFVLTGNPANLLTFT